MNVATAFYFDQIIVLLTGPVRDNPTARVTLVEGTKIAQVGLPYLPWKHIPQKKKKCVSARVTNRALLLYTKEVII